MRLSVAWQPTGSGGGSSREGEDGIHSDSSVSSSPGGAFFDQFWVFFLAVFCAPSKTTFWGDFGASWDARRRFLLLLSLQMRSRRVDFWTFLENRGFLKIASTMGE